MVTGKLKDIFGDGKRGGFSAITIKRAKAALRIESDREGFGPGSIVVWRLPIEAHIHEMSPYDENAPSGHKVSSVNCDTYDHSSIEDQRIKDQMVLIPYEEVENSPLPEAQPVWDEV